MHKIRNLPLFIKIVPLVLIVLFIILRHWPREKLTDHILYSQAVYSSNGELLRLNLAADEIYRLYTPLGEISPALVQATCFYEDRYFRYHPGVNPAALLRGFWTSYIRKQRMMGGSTLTMQLARTLYDIDSTTIKGKIKQIGYALWLEARYSKDDIMEAYLNLAPYGHNIEGVGAASLIYYKKRSKELSTLESLTLCVIPQNPAKRVPTSEQGWQELTRARNHLMQDWVKSHPEDASKSVHFDLPMLIHKLSELPYLAPHFVNGVLTTAPLSSEYFTTLDLGLQKIMEDTIQQYTNRNKIFGINNAAAILIDASSMKVLASVGSASFFNDEIQGQVDGTRAMRSPGSLMKPFIYAAAIDEGLIHNHTLLKDAPRRYGLYSPENADRAFMGPLFARDALIHSRNIPAVDLMLQLPPGTMVSMLKQMGINEIKNEEYYGAALALGGFEMTMEDAAVAYGSFVNLGKIFPLKKLAQEEPAEPVELFSPEAAYMVRDMLQYNIPPTVYGFRQKYPFNVAWKTGTSYRYRDAWTAAVFGNYVLVVWVGNFDGQSNSAFIGRSTAAPLAFQLINVLRPALDIPDQDTRIPLELNLKYVEVCAVTGELPADYCPEYIDTLFVPGISPIKVSEIFQRIPIDIETGLIACNYDPEKTRWEVYEFWPTDILSLYESAGIRRKTPPSYMPGCRLDDMSYTGFPPEIQYPQPHIIYDITHSPTDTGELPLIATASPDVEKIYWFVDNRFLGESANGQPLFWKAVPGQHTLQAIDNQGRSTSIRFETM